MSNLKIIRNGKEIAFKSFLFPGGEIGVKLETGSVAQIAKTGQYAEAKNQAIIARMRNANDILELALLTDALRRFDNTPICLEMPYIPYGRQDRVCDKGESFSLKVFADIINNLNFEYVGVVDPHSNVTYAVFDRLKVITQFDIINKWQDFIRRILAGVKFIAPDAGANKKTSEIAAFFSHRDFIRADKLRDLSNGNILETIVYCDDLRGIDVAICDDICDGGRTFIELAKVLKKKNAGKIILYVTHGIFSKGVAPLFRNGIDEIWTTDSFGPLPNDIPRDKEGDFHVLELEKR